jgi:hypothetical protein
MVVVVVADHTVAAVRMPEERSWDGSSVVARAPLGVVAWVVAEGDAVAVADHDAVVHVAELGHCSIVGCNLGADPGFEDHPAGQALADLCRDHSDSADHLVQDSHLADLGEDLGSEVGLDLEGVH